MVNYLCLCTDPMALQSKILETHGFYYQGLPGTMVLHRKCQQLHPSASSSKGGLKNLMDIQDLIDIRYMSPSYTWTNNRQDRALIQ